MDKGMQLHPREELDRWRFEVRERRILESQYNFLAAIISGRK
jgi:hypothetical protein